MTIRTPRPCASTPTSCGGFVHFLESRGRDLLGATESDLTAYRVMRTDLQDKPVGDAAWAKEAQLINQLYQWLVEQGHLRHRPLRMTRKGRNPLRSRVRRGMDIRHMTLAQYRYFRDVGLGGQLPNSGSAMCSEVECRSVIVRPPSQAGPGWRTTRSRNVSASSSTRKWEHRLYAERDLTSLETAPPS